MAGSHRIDKNGELFGSVTWSGGQSPRAPSSTTPIAQPRGAIIPVFPPCVDYDTRPSSSPGGSGSRSDGEGLVDEWNDAETGSGLGSRASGGGGNVAGFDSVSTGFPARNSCR